MLWVMHSEHNFTHVVARTIVGMGDLHPRCLLSSDHCDGDSPITAIKGSRLSGFRLSGVKPPKLRDASHKRIRSAEPLRDFLAIPLLSLCGHRAPSG